VKIDFGHGIICWACQIWVSRVLLSLYLNAVVSQFAIIIEIELTIQHAAYYKLASYFLRMAELGFDYFLWEKQLE